MVRDYDALAFSIALASDWDLAFTQEILKFRVKLLSNFVDHPQCPHHIWVLIISTEMEVEELVGQRELSVKEKERKRKKKKVQLKYNARRVYYCSLRAFSF